MQTLDASLLAAAQAVASRPMHLVAIHFSGATVRLCSYGDVFWANQEWAGAEVTVEGIEYSASSSRASLRLSNHDSTVSAYLLNQGPNDHAIEVYGAWLDDSDQPVVRSLFQGASRGGKLGVGWATIGLGNAKSTRIKTPRGKILPATGFTRFKPDGYTFQWGGTTYTTKRRWAS